MEFRIVVWIMLLVASWPQKAVELCKMLPSNVTFSHWLSCLDRHYCRGPLAEEKAYLRRRIGPGGTA